MEQVAALKKAEEEGIIMNCYLCTGRPGSVEPPVALRRPIDNESVFYLLGHIRVEAVCSPGRLNGNNCSERARAPGQDGTDQESIQREAYGQKEPAIGSVQDYV